jgi:hypothetical protein
VLKALDFHASQREVAEAAGKSVAWVNRIKKWSKAGFAPAGPFSTESKAKRTRAAKRVQAPEHRPAEDDRFGLGANFPPEDARAPDANGSADTEIDTEARNAAMDAAGAQAADDGSIPEFMRRTASAPAAAAMTGSGSMTAVAETSPATDAPEAVGALYSKYGPTIIQEFLSRNDATKIARDILEMIGRDDAEELRDELSNVVDNYDEAVAQAEDDEDEQALAAEEDRLEAAVVQAEAAWRKAEAAELKNKKNGKAKEAVEKATRIAKAAADEARTAVWIFNTAAQLRAERGK